MIEEPVISMGPEVIWRWRVFHGFDDLFQFFLSFSPSLVMRVLSPYQDYFCFMFQVHFPGSFGLCFKGSIDVIVISV